MHDLEQTIRERAYHLWVADGRRDGNAEAHWLAAQHEVLASVLQSPGSAPATPSVPKRVAKETTADLVALTELIEAGKLAPAIDRTFPLSEAPAAIRYLAEGHARGKAVITV